MNTIFSINIQNLSLYYNNYNNLIINNVTFPFIKCYKKINSESYIFTTITYQ